MSIITDPVSGALYTHECIRCGACCRRAYAIIIRGSDVDRWIQEGRDDIARGLQVDLKSVSPAALIPLSWYSTHPPVDEVDPAAPEHAFVNAHKVQFDALASFLQDYHDNIGTGSSKPGPFIPFWFLPCMDFRSILRPKDLAVVKHGLEHGIRYVTIMAITGACSFLENNECSIHGSKPTDCAEYPVKEQLEREPAAMARFIEVCKGARKLP